MKEKKNPMKRILFSVVWISLLLTTFAKADVSDKNTKLIQTTKDSNLPAVKNVQKEDKFPLHRAAMRGNIEKVKELIAKGHNVNTRYDKHGGSPLHTAVQVGQKEIAELLITNGADINAKNVSGYTPLHIAAQVGQKEIAELLINNGADVNAKNDFGAIPIMLAVIGNYNDVVEMLIANGAEKTIYVAAAQGDAGSVKALLRKDPNLVNSLASNGGWSALHWAAHQERPDVVRILVDNGANVDIRDGINDTTPLYWAVRKGNINAARLLIEKGADVKIKMKNGGTPLHTPGTLEIARLLIDNGADINAKDNYGTTPLHSIIAGGPARIVQSALFQKNGGTARTFNRDFGKYGSAAEKVSAEIAELLIKKGTDINAKDKKGNTPLSIAKMKKNKAMVELLEKAGAKEKE